MAPGIETNGRLKMYLLGEVVCGGSSFLREQGTVQVGHVGLVVLGMMDRHYLFGNVGFECLPTSLASSPLSSIKICYIVSVGELGEGEFSRAHLGFCVSGLRIREGSENQGRRFSKKMRRQR